jgi:hypothetical protein
MTKIRAVPSLVVALGLCSLADSFSPVDFSNLRQNRLVLSVASPETSELIDSKKEKDKSEKVSYAEARGDGSTGGGGLPMPHAEADSGLTRPKVGAPMPDG